MSDINRNTLQDYILQSYEDGDINDPDFRIIAVINISGLAKDYRKALNALLVIANDPKIKEFLQGSDPKAYQQVIDAINGGRQ